MDSGRSGESRDWNKSDGCKVAVIITVPEQARLQCDTILRGLEQIESADVMNLFRKIGE
jgi:hypothetical protein